MNVTMEYMIMPVTRLSLDLIFRFKGDCPTSTWQHGNITHVPSMLNPLDNCLREFCIIELEEYIGKQTPGATKFDLVECELLPKSVS